MKFNFTKFIGKVAISAIVIIAILVALKWLLSWSVWQEVKPAWAQLVASIIGMGIAIGIPMTQRSAEAKVRRVEKAELEAAQAQRICDVADELKTLLANSVNVGRHGYEDFQQHLPDILDLILHIRKDVTHPILGVQIQFLTETAWKAKLYSARHNANKTAPEIRAVEYEKLLTKAKGIHINANGLRHAFAEEASREKKRRRFT